MQTQLQQAQRMAMRIADASTAATLTFFGVSFTMNEVLQGVTLILGILCGAFSLYFHIKKFRSERGKK